ncbi:chemotaxis protein MotA [Salinibacillus kushneri]|uniref:Chemotaxis protein MotA n=1 Tax=Salinibacillus kushneri TaxID=237682 RepID=A0A1I0EQ36_9BACI|nr:flagellar motor stator protein MotA [Salinibacillus kushneri]SET47610.1 chemotaxis protein MotA [Salinibacillus kushneri]
MDKATIFGIFIALIAICLGMIFKGVNLLALFNPAAILIIFFGTIGAVLIAFPMSTIKKVPTLFKIVFKKEETLDIDELINMFAEWADLARKEGLLSLENKISVVDDQFLKAGLQYVIDGQSPEFIRDVLLEKIEAMEQRHQKGALVFSQAGTYAPSLGVLGAVVGLIAALGDLNDIEALGKAISAAFIATLFGILTGYVLWHPFSNKLKEKSKNEVKEKQIMIEGILSITNGESPNTLRDKLNSYLSPSELKNAEDYGQEEDNA